MKTITVNFTPDQVRKALCEFIENHRNVDEELGIHENFENETLSSVLSGLGTNLRLTMAVFEEGSNDSAEFLKLNMAQT